MPGLRPGLRGPLFQEKLALPLEKGASLCWRPSGANICFFYNVVAALHRRSAAFGRRDACLLGLGSSPRSGLKGRKRRGAPAQAAGGPPPGGAGPRLLLSAGAIFFYISMLKAFFTRSIIGHYVP